MQNLRLCVQKSLSKKDKNSLIKEKFIVPPA